MYWGDVLGPCQLPLNGTCRRDFLGKKIPLAPRDHQLIKGSGPGDLSWRLAAAPQGQLRRRNLSVERRSELHHPGLGSWLWGVSWPTFPGQSSPVHSGATAAESHRLPHV